MWTDAHCHLAQAKLFAAIDGVVARASAAGVGRWVQGGVDPADWERQSVLAARFGRRIVTAFGLHPWWVAKATDAAVDAGLAALEDKLSDARLVGETGLDRAVRGLDAAGFARQKRAFSRHLELARATRKPLVLHVVRAHAEAAALLGADGGVPAGGIVHAFNGGPDAAQAYLRLGLLLSVNGAVARPGFAKLKAALPFIPRDRLLVETDAPDGPLDENDREPRDLPAVAAALGALIGATATDLLNASAAALDRLLGKDP